MNVAGRGGGRGGVAPGGGSGTTSRRSSGGSYGGGGGSRRGSLLVNDISSSLGGGIGGPPVWPDPSVVATMSTAVHGVGGSTHYGGDGTSTPPTATTQGPTSNGSSNNLLHTIGSGVVGAASSVYAAPRYRKAFPVYKPNNK